jgi:hypothetical protein
MLSANVTKKFLKLLIKKSLRYLYLRRNEAKFGEKIPIPMRLWNLWVYGFACDVRTKVQYKSTYDNTCSQQERSVNCAPQFTTYAENNSAFVASPQEF